jgi:putative transposase
VNVRRIVLRLARETGWGATRIRGELLKLGVSRISRTTVRNILRADGFDPGPTRSPGSWAQFLRRHAATIWACDFFSARVWTWRGRRDIFVLFYIHLKTRRVIVSGLTANPTPAWMAQHTAATSVAIGPTTQFLLRDRDTKFTTEFDRRFQRRGVRVVKLSPRSPNLNAIAERWVQTVRRECLDHFVICGESHLRLLMNTFVEFYNSVRPHQGLENKTIATVHHPPPPQSPRAADVRCQTWLGGLLRHYYRKAA